MRRRLIAVLLVFVWVSIAIYADTLFKGTPRVANWRFVSGCFLYGVTGFFAIWTYRFEHWGWVAIFWSVASLVVSLIVSVVVYSEPFTLRRALAATLLLGAIFLCD